MSDTVTGTDAVAVNVNRYIQKGPEEWGMWACKDCGSVVWSRHDHDPWHASIDAAQDDAAASRRLPGNE